MKKFKKLIPALCMLLISAVLMGTSTYAWFSMNKTVTATGMTVTANADSAYLIIKEGTSLDGSAKTANAKVTASLKPVAPMGELTSTNIGTLGSWGTAVSDDPNNASSTAPLTALTSGTLEGNGNYLLKQSFMVGIVANSGSVNDDLRLKSITITPTNSLGGITVVVVCGENLYSYDATNASVTNAKLAEKTAVTTTGVQVDVYIYINGKHADVKSANALQLGGSISMDFTIEPIA